MKRRIPESSPDLAGHASPITPGDFEPESQQVNEDRAVGRRALLTRGGVVVAGVVGAGAAGAAGAGPADPAAGRTGPPGASYNQGPHQTPPPSTGPHKPPPP